MIAASGKDTGPVIRAARINYAYVWLISCVGALGDLLFGYDWVVIGGAKLFFESYFHISQNAQLSGWANSCALIGCLLGALLHAPILLHELVRDAPAIVQGFCAR